MLLDTVLNVLDRVLPSVDMAAMAAIEIRAAMRPYSMAVAPVSSFMRAISLRMVTPFN